MPLISVVMGVYNSRFYLQEAIESILSQSFPDFEFIIVNDGSTDETEYILKQIHDPRVTLLTQERQGLTKSLNRAIKFASGKYIARMDADDIANPSRFQKQVDFLEANSEVVVLGTAFQQINQFTNEIYPIHLPETDALVREAMLKWNPFCHPSIMMRKDALEKVHYYDETFPYVQDYELWSRMAKLGKLANLPDILLSWRYHSASISNNWRTEIYRWRLFAKANHLAINRLNGPFYLKILTARTIALFALESLKNSWQNRNA